MKDVEGKTAFITGGASGVGLGMARVFADAGMKVVIADIRADFLEEAKALFKQTNKSVHTVQLDVSDENSFAQAADEAENVFGKVHVVCNNAGINLFKPMDECTREDWEWVVNVNMWGVINGVTTFVPRIKRHGEGGHIVNTASMASIICGPSAGIYTMTKFAVRGLTESLWYNLHPQGIGVSVLCPGLVNSRIYESDKTRPTTLGETTGVQDGFMERLAQVHQVGMDPVEVGEKVLAAIRKDELYIFPFPEFKDEVKGLFDEILDAMPSDTSRADPARLAFEEGRRKMATEARKAGGRP
jgi:NAD(P)-dependent dehydrogenase (short-subunit alcohol dehydrogenase family)